MRTVSEAVKTFNLVSQFHISFLIHYQPENDIATTMT